MARSKNIVLGALTLLAVCVLVQGVSAQIPQVLNAFPATWDYRDPVTLQINTNGNPPLNVPPALAQTFNITLWSLNNQFVARFSRVANPTAVNIGSTIIQNNIIRANWNWNGAALLNITPGIYRIGVSRVDDAQGLLTPLANGIFQTSNFKQVTIRGMTPAITSFQQPLGTALGNPVVLPRTVQLTDVGPVFVNFASGGIASNQRVFPGYTQVYYGNTRVNYVAIDANADGTADQLRIDALPPAPNRATRVVLSLRNPAPLERSQTGRLVLTEIRFV